MCVNTATVRYSSSAAAKGVDYGHISSALVAVSAVCLEVSTVDGRGVSTVKRLY